MLESEWEENDDVLLLSVLSCNLVHCLLEQSVSDFFTKRRKKIWYSVRINHDRFTITWIFERKNAIYLYDFKKFTLL